MSSNLACVGLWPGSSEQFEAMAGEVLRRSVRVGWTDGLEVRRWEDPGGARLVFRLRDERLVGFAPSFAGSPGATISAPHRLNDETWSVEILDSQGETATAAALDLEQGGLIAEDAGPSRAAVIALGRDVRAHADAAAFAASDDSLLAPGSDPGEPPALHLERGWPWPPRIAAESFMSYGVFSAGDGADASARLHGTVLSAEERTTHQTGARFHVVRVRTVGMEVDLCLEAAAHPVAPSPGQVIGGSVYLVASIVAGPEPRPPGESMLARLRKRLS